MPTLAEQAVRVVRQHWGQKLQPDQAGAVQEKGVDLLAYELYQILKSDTGGSGGGIMGKVASGSGTSYQVALYEDGISRASTRTVTVNVPQLANGETIPADTWLPIMADSKGGYSMQPPVWLA